MERFSRRRWEVTAIHPIILPPTEIQPQPTSFLLAKPHEQGDGDEEVEIWRWNRRRTDSGVTDKTRREKGTYEMRKRSESENM